MVVNSMFGDLTKELIDYLYIQLKKKNNKRKLKTIIDTLTDLMFNDIKPYLYTILSILILMFIMNLVQFYYYVKIFIDSKLTLPFNIPNTFNLVESTMI